MRVETARLVLRLPRPSDAEAFAAINADPEVARFVSASGPLTRAQSDLLLRSMRDQWDREPFGLWMAELRVSEELVGFVGLSHPSPLRWGARSRWAGAWGAPTGDGGWPRRAARRPCATRSTGAGSTG